MSRKNVLSPQQIISGQSLASDFSSEPIPVQYMDNIAYQINVTTPDATGIFMVEGSLDQTNWVPLPDVSRITLSGSDVSALINVNQTSMPNIRLSYDAGVLENGVVDVWISAKMI